MNIVVFGAGAIGSLFGGLLNKDNNVLLIGRRSHISAIKNNCLTIEGKTHSNVQIKAEPSIKNATFSPDLFILTVKSYDTESSILQARKIITDDTTVLSIQNGLDNIEKLSNHINSERIIAGITTHGALFSKPGVITHTGKGMTVLGELNGKKTKRLDSIVKLFNKSGIETKESINILKEIWRKAIINSSINPLTAIFKLQFLNVKMVIF
jgi:2-dehydropantoate 2-reductase